MPEGSGDFGLGYHQSVAGCMSDAIGEHGLGSDQLDALGKELQLPWSDLKQALDAGSLALLRVPEATSDIDDAAAALEQLSDCAGTIVFFGTGGSSLGGQTLAQLGGWNIPGEMTTGQLKRPRTRFYDNFDARTLARALALLDLTRTRFVVISKSGNTPETLAQAIAALDAVKAAGLGAHVSRMFLAVTEPGVDGRQNGLRALMEAHDVPILEHHTGIGGRFSALTNVGLLPAMAQGLDPFAVRAGARSVVEAMRQCDDPLAFAPGLGAAVAVGLARHRGNRVSVMMPYSDRLGRFAHWYAQLWAESLGKGGAGFTPVAALGPVDQHSQLQLYMDGPRDHLLTFLRTVAPADGPELSPELAKLAGLDYLAGRNIGELTHAQARAVPEALIGAGRPVRTIDIETLDEQTMGALMMHFMTETILAAGLLGVDPFDQPAVETGKRLARARLEKGA